MQNKPTGTVTFLFTDIEGSTKLSQEFPETLQSALDIHHSIMLETIERNNGYVFEIVGDAFCAAFQNADNAVISAVEAQLNLSRVKWNDVIIKVRIGIHTGDAMWSENRYTGYITLARTARVMSSAYGEQILVSFETFKLTQHLINGKNFKASFLDLGERRLKDVIQPVRIYQVQSKGLRENFPPLKTLDARPNNIPAQLTSFIGREAEMKEIKEIIKQVRLLTLLGSGGIGKTRLAIQAASDIIDEFANGVFVIELAQINDSSFIAKELLNSLGLKEEPQHTAEETLTGFLKDKEMLIIFDNCEHLINQCAELIEKIIRGCHGIKIISTSREALNCQGEKTYKVSPLSLPDNSADMLPEDLSQFEAVKLFLERSAAVNSLFKLTDTNAESVAGICLKLDGIPLAIELAAARVKHLPVGKIYEKLDDRFRILTSGKRTVLPRQQTLRALIDWSYDLLSEKEKIMWSRISVFVGGWTLESAGFICNDEKICADEIFDLLSSLNEKSIIIYDVENDRYKILESLKHYGEEKLNESGEEEIISLKYVDYFIELSNKGRIELTGKDVKSWLTKLGEDHDNFQSAINRSLTSNEPDKGAELAGALSTFWTIRGHNSIGIKILEKIFSIKEKLTKKSLCSSYFIYAHHSLVLGDNEVAKLYFEKSLDIARADNFKIGIADALYGLGNQMFFEGNYVYALTYLEECLTLMRETNNNRGVAYCLNSLGNIEFSKGNYENSGKYFEEGFSLMKEINFIRGIALGTLNLGTVNFETGNFENAEKYFEESLSQFSEMNDKRGIAHALLHLGMVAHVREDFEDAENKFQESLKLKKETGDKRGIAEALLNLGEIALKNNNLGLAEDYFNESIEISIAVRERRIHAFCVNGLGALNFKKGNYEEAVKKCNESLSMFRDGNDRKGIAACLFSLGTFSESLNDNQKARDCYEESLKLSREIGNKKSVADTLCILEKLDSQNNETDGKINKNDLEVE